MCALLGAVRAEDEAKGKRHDRRGPIHEPTGQRRYLAYTELRPVSSDALRAVPARAASEPLSSFPQSR